jgi:hypothetical protein
MIRVKKAEAEAESMHLSGIGVARQREAIMKGFKQSILDFNAGKFHDYNHYICHNLCNHHCLLLPL